MYHTYVFFKYEFRGYRINVTGIVLMSTRRSKLDIQLDVLNAVRKGVDKPTRIMFAVNTSWKPVKKILDRLVDGGLLSVISTTGGKLVRRRYEITEKGISVLNYLEGAKEIMDVI